MALKNVRQAMIDAGRSRKLINKDINRIRQMFGWAVESELLPVQVHQTLRRVKGLRKGRSAARETAPVEPVPEESIRAILPHLSPQVAAMIQLQHLCGARPQEVTTIRPCEVETDGDVWLYQPRSHKTEHLDREKVIVLGPEARRFFALGSIVTRIPTALRRRRPRLGITSDFAATSLRSGRQSRVRPGPPSFPQG